MIGQGRLRLVWKTRARQSCCSLSASTESHTNTRTHTNKKDTFYVAPDAFCHLWSWPWACRRPRRPCSAGRAQGWRRAHRSSAGPRLGASGSSAGWTGWTGSAAVCAGCAPGRWSSSPVPEHQTDSRWLGAMTGNGWVQTLFKNTSKISLWTFYSRRQSRRSIIFLLLLFQCCSVSIPLKYSKFNKDD